MVKRNSPARLLQSSVEEVIEAFTSVPLTAGTSSTLSLSFGTDRAIRHVWCYLTASTAGNGELLSFYHGSVTSVNLVGTINYDAAKEFTLEGVHYTSAALNVQPTVTGTYQFMVHYWYR